MTCNSVSCQYKDVFPCTSSAEAGLLKLPQSLSSVKHKNNSLRRLWPKAERVPVGFCKAERWKSKGKMQSTTWRKEYTNSESKKKRPLSSSGNSQLNVNSVISQRKQTSYWDTHAEIQSVIYMKQFFCSTQCCQKYQLKYNVPLRYHSSRKKWYN